MCNRSHLRKSPLHKTCPSSSESYRPPMLSLSILFLEAWFLLYFTQPSVEFSLTSYITIISTYRVYPSTTPLCSSPIVCYVLVNFSKPWGTENVIRPPVILASFQTSIAFGMFSFKGSFSMSVFCLVSVRTPPSSACWKVYIHEFVHTLSWFRVYSAI